MRRIVLGAATALACLAFTGVAAASSNPLIHGNQIANGAISHSKLNGNSVWNNDLGGGSVSCGKLATALKWICAGKPASIPGPKGDPGATGPTGPRGPQGPAGDSYLLGAYYAVAYYDVGDTNGGAIATVACKSQSDTAISGGASVDDYTKDVPIGQSFPGRMDWSTNTPKPNRLDGWIVQFASQNDSAPEKVKVYALCVPGLNVPVVNTFTESADS